MPFLILAGFLVLCIVALVVSYNGLVRLRNKVNEAWSGIDVQLKRNAISDQADRATPAVAFQPPAAR